MNPVTQRQVMEEVITSDVTVIGGCLAGLSASVRLSKAVLESFALNRGRNFPASSESRWTGLRRSYYAGTSMGKPSEMLADIPGILPNIFAPTLVVQGLHDQAIPQSFAQRAQELIPNSELVHIDCGHFIPLNRSSFIADRLLEFFSGPITKETSHDRTRAMA